MKNKLNRSERKVLLRAFEEKYKDLVWYYGSMTHGPSNITGHPGFEKSVAIRRKYPDECAQLLLKDASWFHGFNSGCLATCRHVAGLRGVRLEQDLDTEGGE